MPKPLDVLCIGHAAYDISGFVDHFPEENSKAETDQLLESGGGPAANAAYLLSRWKMNCAFAGLVGEDFYGLCIQKELAAVGTDLTLLELRQGHATPVSLILINRQNGSRTLVNRKIKGPQLSLSKECLAPFRPRVLLFDGHELEASLAALSAYPTAISILDAGSWREGTATLAGKVDILAASERFALQATGLPDLHTEEHQRECIRLLRERYPTRVIVTLGERGLLYDEGGGFHHLAAFPAQTVDTTAAGDIFHGALAYAVAQEIPFLAALRFASMAASLSVRKVGGRGSIPTLSAVREALILGEETKS